MDESFVFDTFNLCWDAILIESKQFNNIFFSEDHCKITDSRDFNFSIVENRLAYVYKFGHFIINFVEKCISNFLGECNESNTVFPKENIKVCSLSNGPGLDIVGLLRALYKSKMYLNCFSSLEAINLYDSWLNMYKSIVKTAYEEFCLKSSLEHLRIPTENIHVIQSDIFTTITPDAENVIRNSNVLLMVRVFFSSKATIAIFSSTLKKIFSLLKPGALVFFIGSKHNAQHFSKDPSLGSSVKCIYGPQKVTLQNLSVKDNFVENLTVNPQDSGFGYFIVWQKREKSVPIEIEKCKKTRRRKRKALKTGKNQENDSIVEESLDDTDAGSEISFSSCTDSLSNDLKSSSFTNTSDEANGLNLQEKSKSSLTGSVNDIISQLCKINIADTFHDMGLATNECESTNNIASSNLENVGQIKKNTSIENFFDLQPMKNISSECGDSKQINVEATKNKISQEVTKSVKNCLSNDKIDDVTNMQIKISKQTDTPSKKVKNSAKSTPLKENAKIKNNKNLPKTISISQSCESLFKVPKDKVDMEKNNGNAFELQNLIKHCDSLITSLEKITADLKSELCSKNDHCSVKMCSCINKVCSKCKTQCLTCSTPLCCRKSDMVNNICTTYANSHLCDAHKCCSGTKRHINSRPYLVIPL